MKGKLLKQFLLPVDGTYTWLKPGVNERRLDRGRESVNGSFSVTPRFSGVIGRAGNVETVSTVSSGD